jgi:hypothetical protein
MENIINDLNICIEAIQNNDTEDAIKMLLDIQEDLKILLTVYN